MFILSVGMLATLLLVVVSVAQDRVLARAAEEAAALRLRDLGTRAAQEVAALVGATQTRVRIGAPGDSVALAVEAALAREIDGGAGTIVVVDANPGARVAASSDPALRGQPFAGTSVLDYSVGAEADFLLNGSRQHATVTPVAGHPYRVVAFLSQHEVMLPYAKVRLAFWGGAALLFAGLVFALYYGHLFINRRITQPASRLAWAAEQVASGDLTIEVPVTGKGDEVDRLAVAVRRMVDDLRQLAVAIAGSARETNALSGEISAGAEEMAAAAGQIATTAGDLSRQSTQMAGSIGNLAASAERLSPLAAALDAGAREGVERNGRMRALALENRARLHDSSTSLEALAADVEANARATEALATASEEIASFVVQIRKLARQSKLLALNAAMEAARAGEQGQGFAVVADEVRRLAGMSTDAAERTQAVVQGVLGAITESRDASTRAVDTVRTVRAATAHGSSSFEQIETAVVEMEGWTAEIEGTATATTQLVREMTTRLETLAQGTEGFAAAMEEVAASSQQQSASTEEIAAAATTLSTAADRLQRLVGNLRIDDTTRAFTAIHPAPIAAPATTVEQVETLEPVGV